ncbi:hypothetical protein GCM10027612_29270 [Microbispora bryophytorum subsp. camponoti]
MDIRASTVLPARRKDIELQTADGLTLVGEVAVPDSKPPVATLVCLHPLPTHGGMMDSHVLRKASYRLPALADIAVLRFNTRGTASDRGTSQGSFDGGEGERWDVAAALEYADFHDLPNPWLVGWSFGTELALKWGRDPIVRGAILLSPPLKRAARRTSSPGASSAALWWPWCRSTTTTCGRRRPCAGSRRCRRRRSSGWRGPSTCGSASRTCGSC